MKLVADWRKAYKWWSVRLAALLAVMPIVWMNLPPDVKAMIPDGWHIWIVSMVSLGVIVGRLKDQGDA